MKNQWLSVTLSFSFFSSGFWLSAVDSTPPNSESRSFVYVSGAVRQPGRVVWSSDLTIMSAINAVGPFGFRLPKEVFLFRGVEKLSISTKAILSDPTADLTLLPDDKIDVPSR